MYIALATTYYPKAGMNAYHVFFNFVVDDVHKPYGGQSTMKLSQCLPSFQGSVSASLECEVVNHGDGGHVGNFKSPTVTGILLIILLAISKSASLS